MSRRSRATKNRRERIKKNLLAAKGELLKGHFEKQEIGSEDALKKASTGGNSFESKRRKH